VSTDTIPSAYDEYNANNSGHPVILVIALIILIAAVVIFCLLYFRKRSVVNAQEKQLDDISRELREKEKEKARLSDTISRITILRNDFSNELKELWHRIEETDVFKINKHQIDSISEKLIAVKKNIFDDCCKNIYEFVRSNYDFEDGCCLVSIMQYFDVDQNSPGNGSYIQVIAAKISPPEELPSMEPKYIDHFTAKPDNEIPLHVKLFNGKILIEDKHVFSLVDEQEIAKHFVKKDRREENIKQYIGVAVLEKDKKCVRLLLQIDVDKKELFGQTTKALDSFAGNSLSPYVTLLEVFYRYESIVQDLLKKLEQVAV